MKFRDRGKTNTDNRVNVDNSISGLMIYRDLTSTLDISEWFTANKIQIEQSLLENGALLFRGFGISSVKDFQQFTLSAIGMTSHYIEGATPRTHLRGGVYTSTEFAKEHTIDQHNELSYTISPPNKICFYCAQPPATMGQTPIADVSKVLSFIDPSIVEEFEERQGWALMRSYGFGFGPNVKDAFHAKSEEDIRLYCERNDIELLYLNDSKARTKQVRKAVHLHPINNTKLWFNHIAFWHYSCLPDDYFQVLKASFSLEEFPYATFFGDGGEIPRAYIENITDAYLNGSPRVDRRQFYLSHDAFRSSGF